jgi:hypothetical protein
MIFKEEKLAVKNKSIRKIGDVFELKWTAPDGFVKTMNFNSLEEALAYAEKL